MKTSKHKGIGKKVYLCILDSVKKDGKLPQLGMTKQARNKYIRCLKKEGTIKQIGYGTWAYIQPEKQVKEKVGGCLAIRGHAYQFRLSMPVTKNWERRAEYLDKHGIHYETCKAGGHKIVIRDSIIWLWDKCILIYYNENRSYYSQISAKESKSKAVLDLFEIFKKIESLLSINLKINGSYQFRIFNQHYSRVNDLFAQEVNKESSKIKCYYDGRCWLLFDRSLKTDEMEAIHPKTSEQDMDYVVVPFFNDLKEHYEKTGEAYKFTDVLNVVKAQADLLGTHTDQIITLQGKALNAVTDRKDKPFYVG
jgi:hypothetical protein